MGVTNSNEVRESQKQLARCEKLVSFYVVQINFSIIGSAERGHYTFLSLSLLEIVDRFELGSVTVVLEEASGIGEFDVRV